MTNLPNGKGYKHAISLIADHVFFAPQIISSIITMTPQSPLQKWKIKKGLVP